MDYLEIQRLRVKIIEEFSQVSNLDREYTPSKKLNAALESLVLGQKFVTIFNFKEAKFVFLHKIEELLGYSDDEFTIEALNNSPISSLKITSEKDISHKLRYDLAIYELLKSGQFLSSLDDCYEITFRILHKDGYEVVVRRSCYIYEISEQGIPLSHIDIWEILPNMNLQYIFINLISKKSTNANLLFYEINAKILGMNLTNRQLEILKLKEERQFNKEIADNLNITEKTLDNHINRMISKLNSYFSANKIECKIANASDLLFYSRKYGLYPKPPKIRLQHSSDS